MNDLWIGREGDLLHLAGASIQPPLTGCLYSDQRQPGGSAGEVVEDVLTVTLESCSPVDFAAIITVLERYLSAARTYRGRGLGNPVWLGIRPLAADDCWRALIHDGWLEPTGSGLADLTRGRIKVRLHLTRTNVFEGSELELPLTNRNGSRVTGGLAITNHADGAHDNSILIDGEDVNGDLPGCIKLAVTNTSGGAALRTLIVALNVNSNPIGFEPVFEAETGAGGVTTPSSTCSGGGYKALSWTGSDEVELLSWVMNAARVQDAGGNAFRFLLRLAGAVSYLDLWLRLRVKGGTGDSVVGETDWAPVKAGDGLQELGPLPLPPGSLPPGATGMPLKLVLVARRQSAGSHALNLDYLALLAVDGFRRYQAVVPLPVTGQLVDDPLGVVASYQSGSGWLATHLALGAPLELEPGVSQRLSFFHDEEGGLAPVERSLSVRAWFRPRRCLPL